MPAPKIPTPATGTEADLESKALLVATMLLARQMTDLTPVILNNATVTAELVRLQKEANDLARARATRKPPPPPSPPPPPPPLIISLKLEDFGGVPLSKSAPVDLEKTRTPVGIGDFGGVPASGSAPTDLGTRPTPLPPPVLKPAPGPLRDEYGKPLPEHLQPPPPPPPRYGGTTEAAKAEAEAAKKAQAERDFAEVLKKGLAPAGTAENPHPLPPPPPPEPPPSTGGSPSAGPSITALWTESAKKVTQDIAESIRNAFKGFVERVNTLTQALGAAWRDPFGTAAKGVSAVGGAAVDVGKAGIGELVSLGKALGSSFTSILGPMAILGQVVQSGAAGFQLLSGAVNVLAGTLAPLLLPITVALAAAFVELSDQLWPIIRDALPEWIDFIFDEMLPVLGDVVDALIALAKAAKDNIPTKEEAEGAIEGAVGGAVVGSVIPGVGTVLGGAIGGIGGYLFSEGAEAKEERRKEEATGGGDMGKSLGAAFRDASRDRDRSGGKGGISTKSLEDVIKELQLSLGPKASFSGIADVGKQIQLAALNVTPFQARILERMREAIDAIKAGAARRAHHGGTPVYDGAGDYEHGGETGGGGDFGGGS